MIRIVLADDDVIVRTFLTHVLNEEPDLEIVAVGSNGQEAVDHALLHQPDVVLLDFNMPLLEGPEAARQIRAGCPNTRISLLTSQSDGDSIVQGLTSGADTYLVKTSSSEEIVEAIRDLAAGKAQLSGVALQQMMSRLRTMQQPGVPAAPSPDALAPQPPLKEKPPLTGPAMVFISHSSQDEEAGIALCRCLEDQGIRCWIAPRDIPPGATWMTSIMRAIGEVRAIALLYTHRSNESPQVHREIERGLHRGIPLVPVLLEKPSMTDAMELLLATCQWYDATDGGIAKHGAILAERIKELLNTGDASASPNGAMEAVQVFPIAPQSELEVETAHVLFLDLVSYSTQSTETQARWSNLLSHLVHGTPEFRRASSGQDLLTLPTGDGMALVFFRNPLSPIRCAIEIAKALPPDGEMALRMGAHSGVVTRVTDAAGRDNVSGDGINTAQRVMSSGDPGHILVSGALADMMSRLDAWANALTPLGEAEVKHGERVRLYNLLHDGVGNSEPPAKFRSGDSRPQDETSSRHEPRGEPSRGMRQRLPPRKLRRMP